MQFKKIITGITTHCRSSGGQNGILSGKTALYSGYTNISATTAK